MQIGAADFSPQCRASSGCPPLPNIVLRRRSDEVGRARNTRVDPSALPYMWLFCRAWYAELEPPLLVTNLAMSGVCPIALLKATASWSMYIMSAGRRPRRNLDPSECSRASTCSSPTAANVVLFKV